MKFNKKKENELSIGSLARLKAVFDSKQWPIEDEFGANTFDNFCNLLKNLDAEQSELILTLTENFLWIHEFEYLKYFLNAFDSFISNFNFNEKINILICPLITEKDFGKGKSSIILLYLIKSKVNALQKKYPQFNIFIVDTPKSVKCATLKSNTILCLVDDFIGSGKTAISAASFYIKQNFPISQIAIVSLVSMKTGIENLKEKGYNIYTSIIENKGITGHGRDELKEISIMKSIEAKMEVSEDFQFGYEHSEALVKMIRTPNNTFPIYWYQDRKKNINIYAPFPR